MTMKGNERLTTKGEIRLEVDGDDDELGGGS